MVNEFSTGTGRMLKWTAEILEKKEPEDVGRLTRQYLSIQTIEPRPQIFYIQAVNEMCYRSNLFKEGDKVNIVVRITGKVKEHDSGKKNYFTNLEIEHIEKAA